MNLILPDECINDTQRRTLIKFINCLQRAVIIDIVVQEHPNSDGTKYQADWLKHLKFEPPQ